MAEEFVNRIEFDNLKKEVDTIKSQLAESSKILHAIDKKLDIISEKMQHSDKIDELKLQPLDKRVVKLEENQSWLWKTIIGGAIGIVIKVLLVDLPKII